MYNSYVYMYMYMYIYIYMYREREREEERERERFIMERSRFFDKWEERFYAPPPPGSDI